MIKLDDTLLQQLGLGNLPEEEKKKLLAHIYETLEMRVGMKLAEQMSDAQLSEFEQFIDRNDEAGALRWLETNFPNYRDVVATEFEKLKAEVGQAAPQILSSSQQVAAPPVQQSVPQYSQQAYAPPQQSYAPNQPPQQFQQPYQPQPPQQPLDGSQRRSDYDLGA